MALGLRTTGRAAKAFTVEVERELNLEDLMDEAFDGPRATTKPKPIAAMRERHHALARLIAEGTSPGEAGVRTRYSGAHVSVLLSDPAFQDLVEHYRAMKDDQYVDFHKKLGELGVDAAHLLQERLEDEDASKEFSNAALMGLVTIAADRTGFGPSQKTEVNVKVGLADRLMEARKRQAAMIDITPKETDNGSDYSN